VMDEPLRVVRASEPPVAESAETASFEGFVTENQTRLFGSLCLITGSRYEAGDRSGSLRPRTRALGPCAKHGRSDRLRVRHGDERLPTPPPSGGNRPAAVGRRSADARRLRLRGGSRGRARRPGAAASGSAGGARGHGALRLLLGRSRTDARCSALNDPSSSYEARTALRDLIGEER